MPYRHTQHALWILVPLGLCLAATPLAFLSDDEALHLVVSVVALILVATFAIFRCLTVSVDRHEIRAAFGWGWPARRVPLAEVTEVRRVRNSLWHGWGIHFTGDGWVWNIAGFDAVELRLGGRRRLRIGTDEPVELERAIRRALDSLPARPAHHPS